MKKILTSAIALTSIISFDVFAEYTYTIDNPDSYIYDVWLRDNDRLSHFTDRTFYPSNVLRISMSETEGELKLMNDAPLEFNDMLYIAKLKTGETVEILRLHNLPAIAELRVTHPAYAGQTNYSTLSGEVLELSFSDFEGADYDYLPQNEDQEKARPNQSTLSFQFNSRLFDGEKFRLNSSVVWRPETPNAMRYLLGAMVNWSKMVGSEEFENGWMETPFVSQNVITNHPHWNHDNDYHQLSDNGKKLYAQAFEKYEHQNIFSHELKKERLETLRTRFYNLGETGGGGLGGGTTLGVNALSGFAQGHIMYDPLALEKYNNQNWTGLATDDGTNNGKFKLGMRIFAHEAGHTIGGTHKDNFCSNIDTWGINPLTTVMLSGFIHNDKFLISEENLIERNHLWETGKKDKTVNAAPAWNNAWQPIEWGGKWGHHNIELPFPTKTMSEDSNYLELFRKYLEAHNEGWGLEYLKTLPFNQDIVYHPGGEPELEVNTFQSQGRFARFYEEHEKPSNIELSFFDHMSFHPEYAKAGDTLKLLVTLPTGEKINLDSVLSNEYTSSGELVLLIRDAIIELGFTHYIKMGETNDSGLIIWNNTALEMNKLFYNTNIVESINVDLVPLITNVALNKPVYATGVTNSGSQAHKDHVVDGDLSTRLVSSDTLMYVDLTTDYSVASVVVHGPDRTRFQHRMNGAWVSLLDTNKDVIWRSEALHENDGPIYHFDFSENLENIRYIQFETIDKNIELNQLEVFGR